jgi:hypothetical protein
MSFRPAVLILHLGAGLVSSAMAGMTGMLLAALVSAGPGGIAALIFAPYAALVGIKWTGATALVLGSLLSISGAKRPRLRRRAIWAATGAAAALAHYFLPWPAIAVSFAQDERVLRDQIWWLPSIFVLSGIVAALASRSTFRLGGLFVDEEEDGEA